MTKGEIEKVLGIIFDFALGISGLDKKASVCIELCLAWPEHRDFIYATFLGQYEDAGWADLCDEAWQEAVTRRMRQPQTEAFLRGEEREGCKSRPVDFS